MIPQRAQTTLCHPPHDGSQTLRLNSSFSQFSPCPTKFTHIFICLSHQSQDASSSSHTTLLSRLTNEIKSTPYQQDLPEVLLLRELLYVFVETVSTNIVVSVVSTHHGIGNGYSVRNLVRTIMLGLKLVYTRLIGLVPTWEHLASPATPPQTLPGGPQKLRFNTSFSQFSPCPTTCAVLASVCRFHSYCCLPVPADPVFCATRSLPYPLALHVFLVAHHVCLCPAWMYLFCPCCSSWWTLFLCSCR